MPFADRPRHLARPLPGFTSAYLCAAAAATLAVEASFLASFYAFRHARASGRLGFGWWLLGLLLGLAALLLVAFFADLSGVPYWAWLAAWGLAVLVGYRLIQRDIRRQALARVDKAA